MMLTSHGLVGSRGVAFAALLVGCATGAVEKSREDCGADYRCEVDLVAQSREQAFQLQALAQQYAADADLQAVQNGPDSEQAKRTRDLAKQMWARAQEAHQRARELRGQVPHAVVY